MRKHYLTNVNESGLKIQSVYKPLEKPTFNEWVKFIRNQLKTK